MEKVAEKKIEERIRICHYKKKLQKNLVRFTEKHIRCL